MALSFNSDDNDDGLVDDVIDVVVGGGGGGSNNVDGFLVFVVDAALPRGEMTSRRLLLMEGKVNAVVIIVVLATTTTKTKSIDDIISWMIVELFAREIPPRDYSITHQTLQWEGRSRYARKLTTSPTV